jgi:threonine dehydratase
VTGTATKTRALDAPGLEDIRAARERIADVAIRTPLVRLHVDAPGEIWLKLENLQPIGSFKVRGATNAMRLLPRERLERGVYTASAGNMAQGVAWCARLLGVPCDVVVPEHAPQTKLAAIERLGGRTTKLPFDQWWRVLVDHVYEPLEARGEAFIHPVSDTAVIAGNGTIGLEILDDLPDVDTVVVPYGGGGLSCGIAAAVRTLRAEISVYAAEVATAAPFAASLIAGGPASNVPYTPSFVDGIGSTSVLAEMWPLASRLLDGTVVSQVAEVASAVRLLAERAHVIAEGAGAAAVAAALSGRAGTGKIVCVVSGGNIDLGKLGVILQGGVP